MSLAISEKLRKEYMKGKKIYTLEYIFSITDIGINELNKINKHKYYQVIKMLKYLKKSHFFSRIPADLYYDVVTDIIAEALEKNIIDARILMYKLKRKYIPNYIAQIHSKSETWGEWIFHALGEEYHPKGAVGYKTVSLYLPETVYKILEKNQSRSKSIQAIIDLLYNNNKKINYKKLPFSGSKKKKGSVKLPLQYYWKLLILKRKLKTSFNEIIHLGLELFLTKEIRR